MAALPPFRCAAAGAALLCGVLASAPARAQGVAPAPAAQGCHDLTRRDFSQVQDAPAHVASARVVTPAGQPSRCLIYANVAPAVGLLAALPMSGWNGKFLLIGPGGYGGTLPADACDGAVRRGYACVTHNSGHTSAANEPGGGGDGLWAYGSLQSVVDYGLRSQHVAALAGRAIVLAFYGGEPARSYFIGCSAGGAQGMLEALYFPSDFDGVVAIDPSPSTLTALVNTWQGLSLTGVDGKPIVSGAHLGLLHRAAIERCDDKDGLKDGVIEDPRRCDFNPADLACRAAGQADCLTAAEVEAARRMYSGPTAPDGKRLSYGSAPGSETGFLWRATPQIKEDWWRYIGFFPAPGPGWSTGQFDVERAFRRSGASRALVHNWVNPDLSELRRSGSKLLIFQGWVSAGSPLPLHTIDYYEKVERVVGSRAETQAFVRLFMMPGTDHCAAGYGANSADYLGAMERWVERGEAPEMIVAGHRDAAPDGPKVDWLTAPGDDIRKASTFTRPLFAYPVKAQFSGRGDPKDYRSFVQAGPMTRDTPANIPVADLRLLEPQGGGAAPERFSVPQRDQMTAAQRAVVERIESTARAGVSGPFRALIQNPGVTRAVMEMYDELRFRPQLAPRHTELAILLTAKARTSDFVWWAHVPLALDGGIPAQTIAEIRAGRRPGGMGEDEAALYDLVGAFLGDGRVDDVLFARASAHFQPTQLIEIAAIVGQYTTVAGAASLGLVRPPQ